MIGTRRLGLVALAVLAAVASSTACQRVEGGRYVQRVFADIDHLGVGVTYRTAVDFDTQAPVALTLDIWVPRGDIETERPAQMWIHGGGWTKDYGGGPAETRGYAEDAARRGYVGVNISYRLRRMATGDAVLDAYDDSLAAVQWLQANAATYGIDPDAIIAGGFSAGAINAANLVYPPVERPGSPVPVAGAVAIAGRHGGPVVTGRPPVLYFSAVDDPLVPWNSVRGGCEVEIRLALNVCELVSYPNGGHDIAFNRRADIEERTAAFAMAQVLPLQGYYVP